MNANAYVRTQRTQAFYIFSSTSYSICTYLLEITSSFVIVVAVADIAFTLLHAFLSLALLR